MILHRRSILAFTAFAAALFVSCDKHHDDSTTPTPSSDTPGIERYSLLTPGNYWIYEVAHLDTNGAETSVSPDLDSVFVAGDSTINGNTYAVLRHATTGYTITQIESLQRDSAGCLVNEQGQVLFLLSSSDQVIQHQTVQAIWEIDWIAIGAPAEITVPLGTFTTREVRSSATAIGSIPVPSHPARLYRALDHGLVKFVTFTASNVGYEKRLVREHVQ